MWLFHRLWFSGVITFDVAVAVINVLIASVRIWCRHIGGVWTDFDNWYSQYVAVQLKKAEEEGDDV